MSRNCLFILFAAAGLCVSVPTFAQTADDLIGTWASSDDAGRIGGKTVLGFLEPTCNDVWNATDGGAVIGQGRGVFRISREGENLRIADQKPNVTYLGRRTFPDVAVQDLVLAANSDGTMSAEWNGEPHQLTLHSGPDGQWIELYALGNTEYYGRCPVAGGLEAAWIPPEKTRNSYLRCSILYDLLQRAAGSQGDQSGAQYFDAIKVRWSDAALELPATDEYMNEYQAAFETYLNAADPETTATQEFNRCGGPPPTADS